MAEAPGPPPPAVVQAYWKKIATAVKAVHPQDPSLANPSLKFEFHPGAWQSAAGYAGHRQAWLAGAEIGIDKHAPYHTFAIIGPDGRELYNPGSAVLVADGFPLPVCSVENALFVRIASGEQVLAYTESTDPRFHAQPLSLEAVLPEKKLLLIDHGGDISSQTVWEAAWYFTDFDHDGRVDILINRRLQNYSAAESKYTFRNQKLIFKLEPGTLQPRNVTADHAAELVRIFTAAKKDPAVPVIRQSGPIETVNQENHGESIFPSEPLPQRLPYSQVLPAEVPGDVYLPVTPKEELREKP